MQGQGAVLYLILLQWSQFVKPGTILVLQDGEFLQSKFIIDKTEQCTQALFV